MISRPTGMLASIYFLKLKNKLYFSSSFTFPEKIEAESPENSHTPTALPSINNLLA